MSKYSQVSTAIATIEQGRFQILCNHFLENSIGGELHSPGTVEGKDKTRTGKPDAFLYQEDGTYILAEFTTKENRDKKAFQNKLEKDLRDCLDFNALGIPPEKVSKILLCCNSSVEPGIREALFAIAEEHKISLTVITIQRLATFYSTIGKVFARDFLKVPFDTGQILTKDQFLKQYQKKNLSTPLDNKLISREQELQELLEMTSEFEIILVMGQAGVGKSRLCMEVIDKFLLSNGNFQAYYLFIKEGTITEDLLTYLEPGKAYILLIDDVNRQLSNLLSVLNRIIESDIIIKVVATVRDYAKDDVLVHIRSRNFTGYTIRPLSDEIIVEIISGEPFLIQNHKILNRISEISKGNPRLAIMAADVINSTSDIQSLSDASVIYDTYYQSIIDEKHIFNDSVTIKVLGLIAFFNTLDIEEKHDLRILEMFEISLDTFAEQIYLLEGMEVVEIYTLTTVKISDQVLATYFFYRAFLKDRALSLDILFHNYFDSHYWRIKDTMLPSLSTFGEEAILSQFKSLLLEFWDKIKDLNPISIRFLDLFGKYFPNKLFVYVMKYINGLDTVNIEIPRIRKYKGVIQVKDPTIQLLEPFLQGADLSFRTAIDILLQYIAKQNSQLDTVTDVLKKNLYPRRRDLRNDFEKLKTVYNELVKTEEPEYTHLYLFYYSMEHTLMASHYDNGLYKEKNGEYVLNESLYTIKKQFWAYALKNYERDRDLIFDVLISYIDKKREFNEIQIIADKNDILEIIISHFDPENFGDCYLVHEYLNLLSEKGIEVTDLHSELASKFTSKTYFIFDTLRNDRSKYDKMRKRGHEWEEIYQLLLAEIGEKIPVTSIDGFAEIYTELSVIYQFPYYFRSDITQGVAHLIENAFKTDLGLDVLKYYLSRGNLLGLNSGRMLSYIYKLGADESLEFYDFLLATKFKVKEKWLLNFFEYLPATFITISVTKKLLALIQIMKDPIDLYPSWITKYEAIDSDILMRILEILANKYEANKELEYKTCHDFFKESPHLVKNHFNLCKRVYFQQEMILRNDDPETSELFELIKHDRSFFMEYVEYYYVRKSREYSWHTKILTKIWEFEAAEDEVYEAILAVKKLDLYIVRDHLCGVFFSGIKDEFKPKAVKLLEKLIINERGDLQILNAVLDILRNNLPEYKDKLTQHLLDQNDDFETFKQLEFYNNHFSSNGNSIWSDFKAKTLENIYKLITELPNQYRFLEHRERLERYIGWENKHTDWERKLYFRGFR